MYAPRLPSLPPLLTPLAPATPSALQLPWIRFVPSVICCSRMRSGLPPTCGRPATALPRRWHGQPCLSRNPPWLRCSRCVSLGADHELGWLQRACASLCKDRGQGLSYPAHGCIVLLSLGLQSVSARHGVAATAAQPVFDLAFNPEEIKARLNAVPVYTVVNNKNEFVLVAGEVGAGRGLRRDGGAWCTCAA